MKYVILSEGEDYVLERVLNWHCLKSLHYKFYKTKSETLQNGIEVKEFIFRNQRAKRIIEIDYYPRIGLGHVFVRNVKKDKETTFPSFTVEGWLNRRGWSDLPDGLSKEKYIQIMDVIKKTEPFLEFIEKLFLGPLKPILTGETWENISWEYGYDMENPGNSGDTGAVE